MSNFDARSLAATVVLPLCITLFLLASGSRRRDSPDVGYALLGLAWTLGMALDVVSWQLAGADVLRRISAAATCIGFLALAWFSTLADPVGTRRRWMRTTLWLVAGSVATTSWRILDPAPSATLAWALLHSLGAAAAYLRWAGRLDQVWVARPRVWLATGLLGTAIVCCDVWLVEPPATATVLLDAGFLAWVLCQWTVAQRAARPGPQPAALDAVHLQRVLETERQRIAQELHDSLGSHLVGLIALQDASQPGARATAAALEECLLELRIAVDNFHDDGASLVLSLARLRYRIQPSLDQLGIRMQWNVEDADAWAALPPDHARELLRIAQESLTNVMRHSGARRVAVTLCRREQEGVMVLEVRDDGSGLAPSVGAGKGLENMRRRAAAIGAQVDVLGEPGHGTRVWVGYPLVHA